MYNFFCKIYRRLVSYRVYKEIKKVQIDYPDYLIFVAVDGLGDICYHMAFLKTIKEKYQKKILVICSCYSQLLVSLYPEIDRIISLKKGRERSYKFFVNSCYANQIFNNFNNRSNVYSCGHWQYYPFRVMHIPGVTMFDILKCINYEIEDEMVITYPQVPESDLSRFEFRDWDKTILINPHSNFLNTDSSIFQEIANKLVNKGYDVYTNVSSVYNVPINGTRALSCTLTELYSILKKIRLFISVRSGILDFTINSGGRFLVIYDYEETGLFKKAYSLKDWKTESEIFEYESNQKELILKYLDKL